MNSALYEGYVDHRRFQPVQHRFRYGLCMLYLDLAELPEVFAAHRLWSLERFNMASFRRRDYLGDAAVPLDQAVRDRVAQDCDFRPSGPVRMLCQVRYWGYIFNPVVLYYCFDDQDRTLQAVVAEITNTPWNERHSYAMDTRQFGGASRFEFEKDFHVSPFMDMDLHYDWRFSQPATRLWVHMTNYRQDDCLLEAILQLERRPLNRTQLHGACYGVFR